ncbi:MAG: hypothetical protein V7706_16950 [Dietzia psychralcaliphila]
MHSASQSPRPADFHVSADGADVAGLFADPRDAGAGHGEHEQAESERGDFPGAMRASWDDWMPVATTGWGAVVLIAPLLAVHALVWAFGGRRPR